MRRRKLIYKSNSVVSSSERRFSSPKTSRKIINTFHVLQKKLAKEKDPTKRLKLETELQILGGLDTYQKASLLGQSLDRGGDSSKWLLTALPKDSMDKPNIKLLDVGALRNNYQTKHKVNATCIDLNAQSSDVLQADFFLFEPPTDAAEKFDVLCLSLVLNFVPVADQRGKMIKRTHLFLKDDAYLFIVLPLACVENSRYMNDDLFCEIVQSTGFRLIQSHKSKKLVYYLYQRDIARKTDLNPRKLELRNGKQRNNFFVSFG
jgi:25S rRNA (adenine2142-N1)-methyltransferase